jgi:hypothetical protein
MFHEEDVRNFKYVHGNGLERIKMPKRGGELGFSKKNCKN